MTENLLKKSKKKGFTLIELIVVIAIIAIISLIAIPKVMGYQDNAKIKADISNAKTIANTVATLITDGKVGSGLTVEIKPAAAAEPEGAAATPTALAEYRVAKNLQTIPNVQNGNKNRHFWVKISSDSDVVVYDGDPNGTSAGVQIYPDTGSGTYHIGS